MKAVFISRYGPPKYSGAGRGAFEYARSLIERGYEAVYLSGKFSSDQPRCEVIQGVRFYRFPMVWGSPFSHFIFYLQCALWLVRNRASFDIVHFAGMPRLWFPVLIVVKSFKKIIFVTMTLYGSDDLLTYRKGRMGFFTAWLFHQCDAILAISERLVEVSDRHRAKKQPIIHLPYLVDLKKFSPCRGGSERSRLREHYGIPDASPVTVFSGSVIQRKGVDLLVEAWHIVTQSLSSALLYIVGPRGSQNEFGWSNDSFSEYIDTRIRDLGLESNIVFTGEQSERVNFYLKIADLFVLPSRQEGLGLAILEAMATGLPVIVCNQPWLPKNFVRHNETGLVCMPTPDALAECILRVLTAPALAERLGTEARKEAERLYDPDKIMTALIAIYSESMKTKRPNNKPWCDSLALSR